MAHVSLLLSVLVVTACSSDGMTVGDDDDDDDMTGTPDAGAEPLDWQPLITADWSLPPGGENTSDVHSVTLDRDIYVGAIRPIDPPGTHHTVMGYEGSTAGIIYASGVGTNQLVFPEGVGLKLPAGVQLTLQLHIYNTSENPLSGTSGVEIVEVAAADVVQEADLFLPGPFLFNLPPGQESTASGTCTVTQPQTVFALFPHMHQLGTWFKTSLEVDGQTMVLHDAAYDFNEQAFKAFAPIELSPGDKIMTECTWFNTLGQNVIWGESSDAEMCFSILYRFPAYGDELCSS
jgi:hypothetical protein